MNEVPPYKGHALEVGKTDFTNFSVLYITIPVSAKILPLRSAYSFRQSSNPTEKIQLSKIPALEKRA